MPDDTEKRAAKGSTPGTARSELTRMAERLRRELHESNLVIAQLKSEVRSHRREMQIVRRHLLDGNGAHSVLVRLSVVENKLEQVGNLRKARWELWIALAATAVSFVLNLVMLLAGELVR